MAAAALAVLTMAALVPWQLRVQERESIRAPPRRRVQAHRRSADLGAGPRAKPTWTARPTGSGRSCRAASRSSPATAGWSATRRRRRPSCPALENHATRPEVRGGTAAARVGTSQRYSTTLQHRHGLRGHAHESSGGEVRAAGAAAHATSTRSWPTIGSATALALGAALVAALVLSWLFSAPLARRVEAVAAVAQALFRRRLQPSGARLRRGRTGRRGAGARRRGAGARARASTICRATAPAPKPSWPAWSRAC